MVRTLISALFSGAIKPLLSGLSEAAGWLVEEPKRLVIAVLAAALCWVVIFSMPSLREKIASTENLLTETQLAHLDTITNYRIASEQAEADAKANTARVENEWRAINQEQSRDFQNRISALRERYDDLVRLRAQSGSEADPRGPAPADLPAARTAPGRIAEAPRDPQFPARAGAADPKVIGPQSLCPVGLVCLTLEEALIASEQAVQLDELITVVKRQAAVRVNPVEIEE